jgi:phage terminase large subunit-like protein
LRAVKFAVECGPLSKHAKVYKDVIELDNHSIIQALPNDWQGAAGGNYSCVLFDELHAWVYESSRRVFDELVIPPTQPGGVRWIASYAGWEGESLLLKEWWNRALAGECILSSNLPIYHNKAASLLAFIDIGESSWRMPWMTSQYIQETKESERPNTFRRLWLNDWVTNESQFLPEGAWAACYHPDVRPLGVGDRRRVVLGADASTSRDLTALVGVEWNEEAHTSDVVFVRVWKPQRSELRGGKPTVDLAETIGAEVLRLHAAGQLDGVVCDPFQLHSLIIEWEKAGITVIELAQNAGRVIADTALYDAVIGCSIRHYNDPVLNEHMRNAVALETVRGFRLAKEKTSQKIDAAVTLSMALYGVSSYETEMTVYYDDEESRVHISDF